MGRLAAGVAHDFNNVLTAIGGYADLLAGSIAENDPRRADVDAIRDAGSRAAALTRQLLAFGRRQELRPTELDLSDVVDGIVPMLRTVLGGGVDLATPRDGAVRLVRMDRAQLEQAILNLALNARDAMPDGGRVTIDCADEAFGVGDPRLRSPAVPGAYARLTVADTGVGMSEETLAHVFEPFYTTKAPTLGTGLGLSSVEGAIVQSGGFVTVESRLGKGSTFAIHIPRVPVEPTT